MSYSCPIHTEKRGNCKFGLNYQIVGALPKPSRKLYFQVRTNLGPADHVNDLIAGSPGRRWPLNGGVMHFRASPHLSRGWAGDSWWMRTVWWLSRWWGAGRSTHQDHPSSVEDNGRRPLVGGCDVVENCVFQQIVNCVKIEPRSLRFIHCSSSVEGNWFKEGMECLTIVSKRQWS